MLLAAVVEKPRPVIVRVKPHVGQLVNANARIATFTAAASVTIVPILYSLSSGGLCVGDGTTTLLYCPVNGIPTLTITFTPGATFTTTTAVISAGICTSTPVVTSANVLTCTVSPQVGSNTLTMSASVSGIATGGSATISFRSNAAAPILPPIITSVDSTTCFGRLLNGTNTIGFSSCPSYGSSILINGRNFFYTTTLTPGLCQYVFYVTFFQLLCLLPSATVPGTAINIQAFTPGMGQTPPTGFAITYVNYPTITSLINSACTGTQIGFALNGCPSVSGSMLVVKGNNFLPAATLTTGLCSNVIWIDINTIYCTLSSTIAPGTTINVVVYTLAGPSLSAGITISF